TAPTRPCVVTTWCALGAPQQRQEHRRASLSLLRRHPVGQMFPQRSLTREDSQGCQLPPDLPGEELRRAGRRPELRRMIEHLRDGEVVVVTLWARASSPPS